jgi:glycosyltransferase involved in cell wall biosynthesis
MKSLAKKVLSRLGVEVNRAHRPKGPQLVELPATRHPARGTVLLAFVVEPFLLPKGQMLPSGHTHFVESVLLADLFLDMGFAVDVIDYQNRTFVPKKDYDILVSSRVCLEHYAKLLHPGCLKILHITVSHWLLNNTAANGRCLELQRRRGVSLASYKLDDENWAVEHADFLIYRTGNNWVTDSYAYAGKPFARVPLCTHTVYPSPEGKDFDAARHTFLWLGSHGFVHKGLDLVLEAFAGMPEFKLLVCGPIKDEPDFERAFDRELYHTPNIETVGWVDIAGEKFRKIAASCIGLVYPSCAEGASGNVLTCMQAGLIPVISYPSCVDMSTGNGVQIQALEVEAVAESVRTVAAMPTAELEAIAMRAWSFARENHTHERFSREYRNAVETALATVPRSKVR